MTIKAVVVGAARGVILLAVATALPPVIALPVLVVVILAFLGRHGESRRG